MRRALVPGLNGFIGRRVAAFLLKRGYEVWGIGRGTRAAGLDPAIGWTTVDLFDHAATAAALQQIAPTHCLNLAWHIEHGKYWRAPENLLCVQASLNLLLAFRAAGGRRFVGAGSCAEYSWEGGGVLSEATTPLRPNSPFGRFKMALGEATLAYAETTGLSAAWGRVFFVYGPGEAETRLVPHVIVSLLSGRKARTSSGEQVRDFSHVDDIAGALVALLDCDVAGAVNIASGQPVAIKVIVETIAGIIGRRELVELGAVPAQAGEPPLIAADVRRLRDEVGFECAFDLRRGLESTIAYYRQAHRSG